MAKNKDYRNDPKFQHDFGQEQQQFLDDLSLDEKIFAIKSLADQIVAALTGTVIQLEVIVVNSVMREAAGYVGREMKLEVFCAPEIRPGEVYIIPKSKLEMLLLSRRTGGRTTRLN